MAYDKDSFLSGVVVGRNLEGWPDLRGTEQDVFIMVIDTSLLPDYLNEYAFMGQTEAWREITVDWGDGNKIIYPHGFGTAQTVISHEYTIRGMYIVKIIGRFLSWASSYTTAPALIALFGSIPFAEVQPSWFLAYPTEGLFANCRNLIYIDPLMFSRAYNGLREHYHSYVFYGCSSLKYIPDTLFSYFSRSIETNNTIDGCFYECSSLEKIPDNLFHYDYFSRITSARETFYGCTALTEIPESMFRSLTGCADFSGCFQSCASLEYIPLDLFDGFLSVTADSFYQCFMDDTGITSAVPELWNRFQLDHQNYCYWNCINAQNYNNIPVEWGGPYDN